MLLFTFAVSILLQILTYYLHYLLLALLPRRGGGDIFGRCPNLFEKYGEGQEGVLVLLFALTVSILFQVRSIGR